MLHTGDTLVLLDRPDGAGSCARGYSLAGPPHLPRHARDITDSDVRAIALPLGLVDVKVAALDEDRSGLRLVWRL